MKYQDRFAANFAQKFRPITSWCLSAFQMLSHLCLLILIAAITSPCAGKVQDQQASAPPSVAYLLVIDRSASMNEPDDPANPEGPTRWDAVRAKAKEFIRTVPYESHIWICSFSSHEIVKKNGRNQYDTTTNPFLVFQPKLETPDDRAKILELLDSGIGEPRGNTFLYDAMGLAFDEAGRLTLAHENRNISVLIYTDGEDNKSVTWPTRAALEAKYDKQHELNENLWVFLNRIDASGEPIFAGKGVVPGSPTRQPVSLALSTNRIGLDNPVVSPHQTVELQFSATDEGWERLKGTTLRLKYVPDGVAKVAADIKLPEVALGPDVISVPLDISNATELDPTERQGGKLELAFDAPEGEEIICNPQAINLSFRAGDQLEIFDFRPHDEATFAVGQPVHFWLHSSQNSNVLWELDDGTTFSEADFQHVFRNPGKKEVTVKVTGSKADVPAMKKFAFEIIELPIDFVMPVVPAFVGSPVRINGAISPVFGQAEWVIDGVSFPAAKTAGGPTTTVAIEHVFATSGEHTIQLLGRSDAVAAVTSPGRTLLVRPEPRIEIVNRTQLKIFEPIQFRIDLPNPELRQTDWQFDAEQKTGSSVAGASQTDAPTFNPTEPGKYKVALDVTWVDNTTAHYFDEYVVRAAAPKADVGFKKNASMRTTQGLQGEGRSEVLDDTAINAFSGTTQQFTLGNTIQLEDNSTGDILKRTWRHNLPDGTTVELASEQSGVVLDQLGMHRFHLVIEGYPERGSDLPPPTDEDFFEILVVPPKPYMKLSFFSLVALLLTATTAYFSFGNQLRHWKITSRAGTELNGNEVATRLKDKPGFKWDYWRKVGRLPISSLAPGVYWKTGGGKKEYLTIQSSGKNLATISYSGERSDGVRTRNPERDGEHAVTLRIEDRRCPEVAQQNIKLKLARPNKAGGRFVAWAIVVSVALLSAGFIYWFITKYFE